MKPDTTTDFFGISTAIMGVVRTYFRCAKGTGRTVSMINSLKDGDRVIFATEQEAKYAERLCRDRKVKLLYSVIDPRKPEDVFHHRGTPEGRSIFDHGWLEQYYLHQIAEAEKRISYIEQQSSGYGEAHIKTKLKAQELARWMDV